MLGPRCRPVDGRGGSGGDAVPDVFLVRHGEAESNAMGYISSTVPGPPLTALGRRQAERAADLLARRLRGRPVRIVSSPMRRALETALATAVRFGAEVAVVDGLREVALGTWEGRPWRDLLAQDPSFAAWRNDPEGQRPPGGESASEVEARVRAALTASARSLPDGVALVAFSHQDAIGAMLAPLRGIAWSDAHGQRPELLNGVVVHLRHERPDGPWRFVSLDPSAARVDAADARAGGGT